MTNSEKMKRMEHMSQAIIAAIKATGDANDTQIVLGALGTVVGCIAQTAHQPESALDTISYIAQAVMGADI